MSSDPSSLDAGGRPMSRRRLLVTGGAVTTGAAVGAAGTGLGLHLSASPGTDPRQIPATENLMREHGVLDRVLLVYAEAARRITADEEVPAAAIHDSATIIHDYIESFHEALEEGYVFPRLQQAGQLVSTVDTLLVQHARGRRLTQSLLANATATGLAAVTTRAQVGRDLELFVRMYQPHEAREDTVVFPAYRALLSPGELDDVAHLFSSYQDRQFGPQGFEDAVAHVASIEATLDLSDLDRFTPPAAG